MLALHGLPAWQYLTTTDEGERLMLNALARRAVQVNDALQRNLAGHVVNALGKAMR